jgi:hypothetical protein
MNNFITSRAMACADQPNCQRKLRQSMKPQGRQTILKILNSLKPDAEHWQGNRPNRSPLTVRRLPI